MRCGLYFGAVEPTHLVCVDVLTRLDLDRVLMLVGRPQCLFVGKIV